MEDQEKIQTEEEEVEAHRRHGGHNPNAAANQSDKDEGEDEGDFELHRRHGGHSPN